MPAQPAGPDLFSALRWRMIGPFRGGRTRAAAGVAGQPNLFYAGAVNGGVWKTIDYGRTWSPIFDDQPTGSIGAIAVAESDPNIIYVGSGEGLHRPDLSTGDGIYKSTDAGKTWKHLGLRDGQQIADLAVDPHDANRLFVAVLGHPYGPNPMRGIFRSTDGGENFEQVLFKDQHIGGSYVEIDPADSNVVYAGLWEAREGPWENAGWEGTGGGLFKSTDGGNTWTKLTRGLPAVVQVNAAIARSRPTRMYASVAREDKITLYRSDDAGESWSEVTKDPRPQIRVGGGGELPVVKVDPRNPDVVYVMSVVAWKSVDGGKTWTALRGAPGGDDYQNLWINPDRPETMLMGSDQGAIVTVDGGETWSSWYNQPTAQLYHANTDNAFPYHVCSGQQESGSVCIASRGNDGEITMRDWRPVGAEEYGYVVPDPADPRFIYGGKLTRFDRQTTQAQDIMPVPLGGKDFRVVRTAPIAFSPQDSRDLYFAANTLWKTHDEGRSWQQVSPDLSRLNWELPVTVGKYSVEKSATPTQRGVIYALALSPLDAHEIWAGTDDGLIHLTTDGGLHWTNVTPPPLTAWAKVSVIDAGHFDAATAYAAVNTLRLDELHPHIFRTHDKGKSWTEIHDGISDGETVNAVREDPLQKGLLFAATERQVYVSLDDGDHWQSLRLNMPATSVRDLVIKGDDLVAATHGRGFWIIDNITPLRQMNAEGISKIETAYLFHPQTALRVRWNTNSDTPLPPDTPVGENPPDGAIIDYFLQRDAETVILEIVDHNGQVVRRYASSDAVPQPDPQLDIPAYWVRPPQPLSAAAGMHRFLWDLHYAPITGIKPEFPISAVPRNTAPSPTSPWVVPEQYSVRLTVHEHGEDKSFTQPLMVQMDPRVRTSAADLDQQYTLSIGLYEDMKQLSAALDEVAALRSRLKELKETAHPGKGRLEMLITALEQKVDALAETAGEPRRRRRPPPDAPMTLNRLRSSLRQLFDIAQGADAAPTTQEVAATENRHSDVAGCLARWSAIKLHELAALNEQLRRSKLPEITAMP